MDIMVLISLIGMAVLFVVGVEIVAALGIGTIALMLTQSNFPIWNIGLSTFSALNIFPILAVPLFILTGDLIYESGIARRLTEFARSVVGWMYGGLVLTSIVAAAFFAAISGSNAATVAAIGRIMLPNMEEDKYPIEFSAATIAAGGTVGIIIPPSIVLVIYGVATGLPISDLFLAGIIPGILMMLVMCCAAFVICRRNKWGTRTAFDWRVTVSSAWGAKLAFIASAIILGGIYGGIFTPTEAAAVAVAYCLLAGFLLTRELKLESLPAIANRSADMNGMIAPIVALSIIFSEIVSVLRLPDSVVYFLLGLSENGYIIMLAILAILLVAGAVMEAMPNVMLLTPMLAPLAVELDIDLIHFGVVMVVTLSIGFITPPLGINLFVASSISGVPYMRIARQIVPYIMALLALLLVLTYVPSLSLMLV